MKPFQISISDTAINDLNSRLDQTRWPDEIQDSAWEYGTNMSYLKALCHYWRNDYNWQEQENNLNLFHHFKTDTGIHFIHERGKGTKNIPLMLIHGWPDSFYRFVKLIPLLAEPDENGVAFDIVVPSIPGFGFSDKPTQTGMSPNKIATLFNQLMTVQLGYNDFYIHGGDWGSSIASQMAMQSNNHVRGLHLTNVPPEFLFSLHPEALNEEEKNFIQNSRQRQMTDGAYMLLQRTKPQTLAYGLNDSPVGLASWIIEKFRSWSDNSGDIEERFSKDELLTNLSIYWFTQTAGSASRIYYEAMHQQPPSSKLNIEVPVYMSVFPKDPIQIPETIGRRFFNLKNWEVMPEGGHFPAMEVPGWLATAIRKSLLHNLV